MEKEDKTVELRIAGFGGQGVILACNILGRAAALYDNKNATMTQSFGPEARGGACSAQLILSEGKVLYPYITSTDIFVAMSQEAYSRYVKELKEGGILIIEEELVRVNPDELPKGVKLYKIPATRFAEEVGRRIVLNIVMIGFFTAISRVINPESVKKAILDSVPKGTEELNLKAFEKGYNWGVEKLG
jgi:2-oxoglutarate ferredoxin oxidoreductase subunit gamma